jgi:quercetin dioxygenase-like cupin family protein
MTRVEAYVPSILSKDGVASNNLFSCNKEVVSLDHILGTAPEGSWSYRVVNTDSNSATIICQNPGEGNREHYHPDWNEWWFILEGEWEWEIEGSKKIVKSGDFVFIEKGRRHKITAVGDERAIRLAVSREDVEHVYD